MREAFTIYYVKRNVMLGKNTFDLSQIKGASSLAGKFIVASPFIGVGDIFNRALIYIADHTSKGAVGLMVNHHIYVDKVLGQTMTNILINDTNHDDEEIILSPNMQIFLGGPLDPERGFIIHSAEYKEDLLTQCDNEIAISCSAKTLKSIVTGRGPKKSLLVMGYTAWDKGQLEKEIEQNLWMVTEGDSDLIFNTRHQDKWKHALQRIGVDQSLFCGQIGHG